PRRVALMIALGFPAIPAPTIGATTGDRPAASGFTPAPTGFATRSKARPATPTPSSSPRPPLRAVRGYGLVVLVPWRATPGCHDAVTVRSRPARPRSDPDCHGATPPPAQPHVRGQPCPRVPTRTRITRGQGCPRS